MSVNRTFNKLNAAVEELEKYCLRSQVDFLSGRHESGRWFMEKGIKVIKRAAEKAKFDIIRLLEKSKNEIGESKVRKKNKKKRRKRKKSDCQSSSSSSCSSGDEPSAKRNPGKIEVRYLRQVNPDCEDSTTPKELHDSASEQSMTSSSSDDSAESEYQTESDPEYEPPKTRSFVCPEKAEVIEEPKSSSDNEGSMRKEIEDDTLWNSDAKENSEKDE